MSTENRNPGENRDDVAALIKLAGRRPPISEDRIERARAAARQTWLRENRRRSRNRFIYGAVTLAAAASLVLLSMWFRPVDDGVQVAGVGGSLPVQLLSGTVSVQEPVGDRLSEAREMVAAEPLATGTVLSTSSSRRAALELPSGHSLRLDLDTRLLLVSRDIVELERGAIYLASGGVGGSRKAVSVRTALGVIREIGTQFEVRLESGALRVRVREGAIVLSPEQGREREARPGTELRLDADGTLTSREVSPFGDEWAWVAEVTPMLSLDGKTARSFLHWISREKGWSLEYADEELERSAGTIKVSGNISGMTLDQALEAVLLSSQLSYRLEDGVLTVEASSPGR